MSYVILTGLITYGITLISYALIKMTRDKKAK